MDVTFLITLVFLGLGGGFLSGLLGLGGAIFMIPLLLYVPPILGVGLLDMKQVPVLVKNLLSAIEMKTVVDPALYNGYTSCPLTTGYGKLLLAEFDHDNKLMPSFPLDPRKERYSMWLLVKYFIPWFYWNRMLKGKI